MDHRRLGFPRLAVVHCSALAPICYQNNPFKSNLYTMEPTAVSTKAERKGSAPVKRRVSRACDHCHRMRTRCNGQAPCSRCIELEYVCQYDREKKRRGKVPRHIQRQRTEAAAASSHSLQTPNDTPIQHTSYSERPRMISELEEDVWSHSEPTSAVQQHPSGKRVFQNMLSGQRQPMHPVGQMFDQPVHQTMIDPIMMAPGIIYPPIHTPRTEEVIHAIPGMRMMPGSIASVYTNTGFPMQFSAIRRSSPTNHGYVDNGPPYSGLNVESVYNGSFTSCR
ncbi:hypothetical protein P153DRAFT_94755 [Dothidotthia symphoricarpi CBS 119687]|uniref:Zn(2)-C6 fungal-type domain-containing protein n=1 Tax=Dothidotthia symphoricarpi CBS 119687 TaxID=1392245 RepID=A0A6A6A3S7_9PLEO|nr:uncharacterized protein P153DRAFT_94755 [Dothidotthia symphoricarpi CBS 119687]KAF2125835.1 hypothetical protein P153DRAFT_94755 [Dothidotthia symphoricarpi CBS 119687]